MPVDSKGGPEHAVDNSKVCAFIDQWQAEAATIFGWKNMAVVPHPPYPLMWLPVILSCFKKWNLSYRSVVSRISLKCRNNCWLSYMWFEKASSSIASGSGRNAGPIALTQKVTVMWGRGLWPTTKLLNHPRNFWIHPCVLYVKMGMNQFFEMYLFLNMKQCTDFQ